jgi:ubiquitin thioesterase OTU1
MPTIKLVLPHCSEKFTFDESLTIEGFFHILASKMCLDLLRIQISHGYPPLKRLDMKRSELLVSIIQNGEVVTVRENERGSLEDPTMLEAETTDNAGITQTHISVDESMLATIKTCIHELGGEYSNDVIASAVDICGGDNIDLILEVCCQLQASSAEASHANSMQRKEISSDNSCLFNAVLFVLGRTEGVAELRRQIAETVEKDPLQYNEGFLGKSARDYGLWIMKKDTWGGEIELSILSSLLRIEIAVVDIQTSNVYIYGEHAGLSARVYLLYDGIHYDAIYRAMNTTKFSPDDSNALSGARTVASTLKARNAFVDVYGFQLRCNSCGCKLRGQKDAVEHAKATGHTDFGEYS